jgi:uncharacterized membrane protein
MIKMREINLGCHGIPERCFYHNGKPMPFCSRCFGCGIGHIFSLFLFLFGSLPSFLIAVLLIMPLAIDWSVQKFIGILSNNYRRLITGILGGFGVGIIIWRIVLLILSF